MLGCMCGRGWFVCLITVVRRILNIKGPLERRLEGSEEVCYTNIWWRGEHSEEQIASAKALVKE